MNTPIFSAIPTDHAKTLWSGSPDAYDRLPERMISPGGGMPCRHCLRHIEKGEELLVLAYRPFPALQPYAETGPIFLHAKPCSRYNDRAEIPPILSSPDYIVRGYGIDDRIVYGSGAVTPTERLVERAEELLAQASISYLHVRSARNNCYQCRIERSEQG
ncbi:hypothetical protein ABID21_003952 [Pseudorhizobium tarimense]|uniref:DUF1203 domain-containing protein n=1 Tax=Pseudorhizobium tarimense TaxID=1079109 RepID=A0ABV2HB98_9HYPH|nr:DUF1203 domain-containing protein [Pseudorhizobium tarimense]MCJ8520732.1 DUF1203 domain-containing protein [Pseudorhizobium tarimense]